MEMEAKDQQNNHIQCCVRTMMTNPGTRKRVHLCKEERNRE
ncbi:hypothetical protein T4C_13036 [Trichinella pseudospiralis]|uniref:Uncharacterized protein n=1 Tax=Trichinella pseudospiralis TaxID=6337 RepID=A0A0V1GBC9_TRIPS|nr:hypothetical protein T4C_13036 [Trichinella pseudospiralis]